MSKSNGNGKNGKGVPRGPRIKVEDFIIAWQQSESVEAVAKTFGKTSLQSLKSKAAFLRKKEIPLKKFPSARAARLNVPALKKLAAESLPKSKSKQFLKSQTDNWMRALKLALDDDEHDRLRMFCWLVSEAEWCRAIADMIQRGTAVRRKRCAIH